MVSKLVGVVLLHCKNFTINGDKYTVKREKNGDVTLKKGRTVIQTFEGDDSLHQLAECFLELGKPLYDKPK